MADFMVAGDHPALAGHFPGRPVVPGVVVLEEALACVMAELPGRVVAEVTVVKFLRAVLPGQTIAVAWSRSADDGVVIAASEAGQVVMRGRVRLR